MQRLYQNAVEKIRHIYYLNPAEFRVNDKTHKPTFTHATPRGIREEALIINHFSCSFLLAMLINHFLNGAFANRTKNSLAECPHHAVRRGTVDAFGHIAGSLVNA